MSSGSLCDGTEPVENYGRWRRDSGGVGCPDVVEEVDFEQELDEFLLRLPLGSNRHAADIEDAIAARLRLCEAEKNRYKEKAEQW